MPVPASQVRGEPGAVPLRGSLPHVLNVGEGRTRLRNDVPVEPSALGGYLVEVGAGAAGRVSKEGHPGGVPTKGGNVLLDPSKNS